MSVGSQGWTWGKRVLGRLKVRHDAAAASVLGEWTLPASSPTAAWISPRNTYQACLTSVCLAFIYETGEGAKSRKERKHFRESVDNRRQGRIELLRLFPVTFDKMTVFSLSSFNFPLLNNRCPEFWWVRQLEINFACRAPWRRAAVPTLIKSTLSAISRITILWRSSNAVGITP